MSCKDLQYLSEEGNWFVVELLFGKTLKALNLANYVTYRGIFMDKESKKVEQPFDFGLFGHFIDVKILNWQCLYTNLFW